VSFPLDRNSGVNMTKRRRLALICAAFVGLASALVPLHVDAQKTDRAKALGAKLMCMCGCGQILTQCNHINCPSSGPMLKELDAHVAKGEADDLIVQDFVQEYGEKVLSAPPATGSTASRGTSRRGVCPGAGHRHRADSFVAAARHGETGDRIRQRR
jgi:hypothetical protein